MTHKELYREAYRRVRIVRSVGKTPTSDNREPMLPLPIPSHIRSAAIASFKNRRLQECIDTLGMAEYYD